MTAIEILSLSVNSVLAIAFIVNSIYQNGRMKSMEKFVSLIKVDDFEKYVTLKMKNVAMESEEKINQIEAARIEAKKELDKFKEEIIKASKSNEELEKKLDIMMLRQEIDYKHWGNSAIKVMILSEFISKCLQDGKIEIVRVDAYLDKMRKDWGAFLSKEEFERLYADMITIRIPAPEDVLRATLNR